MEEVSTVNASLDIHSDINSDKGDGERSGRSPIAKRIPPDYFNQNTFRLLKKVVTTLKYTGDSTDKSYDTVPSTLDSEGLRSHPKKLSGCSFPKIFNQALQAESYVY